MLFKLLLKIFFWYILIPIILVVLGDHFFPDNGLIFFLPYLSIRWIYDYITWRIELDEKNKKS